MARAETDSLTSPHPPNKNHHHHPQAASNWSILLMLLFKHCYQPNRIWGLVRKHIFAVLVLGRRRTEGPHLWFWATSAYCDNGTMCMTGKMGSDRWEHEPTEESVIILLSRSLSLCLQLWRVLSFSLSLAHTFPLHVGQCLVFRNLICPG